MHAHDLVGGGVGGALDLAALALGLLFVFIMLFRSPFMLLWFRPASPVLRPLGFRAVCLDRSVGIYTLGWRREWVLPDRGDVA